MKICFFRADLFIFWLRKKQKTKNTQNETNKQKQQQQLHKQD